MKFVNFDNYIEKNSNDFVNKTVLYPNIHQIL